MLVPPRLPVPPRHPGVPVHPRISSGTPEKPAMQPRFRFPQTPSFRAARAFTVPASCMFIAFSGPALAVPFFWDADGDSSNNSAGAIGGTGSWDTTSALWWNTSDVAWDNAANNEAFFQGTAGTVTLAEPINAHSLFFGSNGYLLTHGGTPANVLTLGGTTPTIQVTNATDTATLVAGIAGTEGFTKAGQGTLVLAGAHSYTGATTLSTGTLTLDFSAATSPLTDPIANTSPLVLGSGTLNLIGKDGEITSQTFTDLTLAAKGNARVNAVSGAGGAMNLIFGTLTRNTGGEVDFIPPAAGGIFTGATNTNGILGGYATVNGTSWATVDTSTVGALPAGSYLTTTDGGTTGSTYTDFNVDVTGNLTPDSAITPNSLRFNVAAPCTLTLTGTNIITSGGILTTPVVGSNALTITGGTLQGAAGADLIFKTNGSGLTIGSIIADNTSATALVKSGNGTLTLNSANSYTGGTIIKGGQVQVGNTAGLGTTGTITLGDTTGGNGAILRSNSAISRPLVLGAGTSGTLIVATLGNSSPNYSGGVTGANNLTIRNDGPVAGTNTLTFSAAVNPAGTLSVVNGVGAGLGGNITISGAVGANVKGVIVNSANSTLTLSSGSNAYTGGTTITAGKVKIGANNALPDGAGKGDVVVNGTLDLNAKTDTINGLTGAGTIDNALAGTGTLTIGGANATSTFNGLIKNTTGTTAITKTGTGTLTLTHANTHSGLTTIAQNGGTLVITDPAALGTGPVTIAKNGTNSGTLALQLTGTNTLTNTFNGFQSSTAFDGGGAAGIRNVSGNNKITSNLTLTATGGNGITVQSDSGDGNFLELSGTISSTVNDNFRVFNFGGTGDGLVSGPIVNGLPTAAFPCKKDGSGTWTFTGTNTYTGSTTILQGTLRIGNGGTSGTLGAGGGVANNGTLAFNRSDALAVPNVISGTGSVVQSGGGVTTLSAENTYTGDTVVSAGTLELTHDSLDDDADVRLTTGATLKLSHEETDTIDQLYINGVLQAGGTWGPEGSGATHESALITGEGKLFVTHGPGGGDPYDSWATDHFLAGPDAEKDADPDHDGLNNLQEFALNGDPRSPAANARVRSAVSLLGEEYALTLTLPVRAGASFDGPGDLVSDVVDGLTYKIQGSTDLADFLSINVEEVSPALTSGLTDPDEGWEYRTFRLSDDTITAPRGFLRAVITESP